MHQPVERILKKSVPALCFGLLASTLLFGPACAAADAHGAHSGIGDSACGGNSQSPINLTGFIRADLNPIQFSYRDGGDEIVNSGHTVQVNFVKGSSILFDGIQFELKQFHFHAPSEHQIEGKSYPMEAHLMHADRNGNLAVVAIMIQHGEPNTAIDSIWFAIPDEQGEMGAPELPFSAAALLPGNRDYYRFSGSLTTPPCTEGVRWIVMKQPISASAEQVATFSHLMRHPNNWPTQAINAREVLEQSTKPSWSVCGFARN
jgi:carbonic anhydrase